VVKPFELVQESTYFILLFEDEALTVPLIQTLIYVGPRKSDAGIDGHLFDYLKPDDEVSGFFVEAIHLEELVTDREGLIRKLQAIGGGA